MQTVFGITKPSARGPSKVGLTRAVLAQFLAQFTVPKK